MPTVSLLRGKTHPLTNECSRYDTKSTDSEVPRVLRNVEYPFIAITLRSTVTWCHSIC